jgi:hypothetical protein
MDRQECITRWKTRKQDWARLGVQVKGAMICEEVLADLQEVFRTEENTELTLDEAAAASGYSSDHIRRLARTGVVLATRRGRRLFFRQRDLPCKPSRVDPQATVEYDPIADARQVALWRTNGRQ